MQTISKSEGDYLKAIYALTLNQETTSTLALAEVLNVKPPSVTNMLSKLAGQTPPLVNYQKRQGVNLTKAGKETALRLIRRHRLLEVFLTEILKYDWKDVHPEADELEHVISAKFEHHLCDLLGNPQFDPHGDPIPDHNLILPDSNTVPLSEMHEQIETVVRRIKINKPEVLHYLSDQGITPGTAVMIKNKNPYDKTLQLLIGTEQIPYAIGPELSTQIFVEKPKN